MRLKYFCKKCEMKIYKKEIKRHQKLGHQVIEIKKEVKEPSQTFEDFKKGVLSDLK